MRPNRQGSFLLGVIRYPLARALAPVTTSLARLHRSRTPNHSEARLGLNTVKVSEMLALAGIDSVDLRVAGINPNPNPKVR